MNMRTPLHQIVEYLNSELNVSSYSDIAYNGLQIQSSRNQISKIAFAVDAGLSIMEEAVAQGCELLVVHHGVLWGKPEPVVGPWARKLETCLRNGLSLYAAHLPLDGHPTYGNAAQLAAFLGAEAITPAFELKGSCIGSIGTLPERASLQEISAQLASCEGALKPLLTLPFGKTEIQSIGIATGSATSLIPEVAMKGLDLFITGEPKQEAYHLAKELQCSVICMGHYASETFGVRALERVLEAHFRVQTVWISEPTGI